MRALPLFVVLLLSSGCDVRSMRNQAKHEPYEPSPLFQDGTSMRPQVEGTVAAGSIFELRRRRAGLEPADPDLRPRPAMEVLQRGREQFDVFCAPCHGRSGHGDGMVVRRGFPRPPSYHIERLRDAPLEHFVRVMSQGLGKMPPYASQVKTADRWAIARYIRALQFSQHAVAAQLPETDRSVLEEGR